MEDNYHQFKTERERRRCKVFFRLAKILKRRTPDQCRSHHQKLQIKFKDDLPVIMQEVRKRIHRQVAEEYISNCPFHSLPHYMEPDYNSGKKIPKIYKMMVK